MVFEKLYWRTKNYIDFTLTENPDILKNIMKFNYDVQQTVKDGRNLIATRRLGIADIRCLV